MAKEYYIIRQLDENLPEYDYPPRLWARCDNLLEVAKVMKSQFAIEKWTVEEYKNWLEGQLEEYPYIKILIDEGKNESYYLNEVEWKVNEIEVDTDDE